VQGGARPQQGLSLLLFRPSPIVHLGGPNDLSLSFTHGYVVAEAADQRQRWAVHSGSYGYELLLPNGRQLLAYHWHPDGRSPVTWPHLHLRSHTLPLDVTHAHLPTGRITFEAVLRLAITELAVPPRRADWGAVLDETELIFREWASWGRPPDPSASNRQGRP
jgi:hypothetical protein